MIGPNGECPFLLFAYGCLMRTCRAGEWLPALLAYLLNSRALFHIVLEPLSAGRVDTMLVSSSVHTHIKTPNLLIIYPCFSKYKSIFSDPNNELHMC